jgi:hypothetical protein
MRRQNVLTSRTLRKVCSLTHLQAIEAQRLAQESLEPGLGSVTQSFDGSLPRHPPSHLRAYVERRFSRTDRVADLAAAALGTRSNTS